MIIDVPMRFGHIAPENPNPAEAGDYRPGWGSRALLNPAGHLGPCRDDG